MKNPGRSFFALNVTQFMGAFNDNLFKVVTSLLIVQWVSEHTARNNWVSLSGAIFVAPFLLFSLGAGRAADRWSKARVMTATKAVDIFIVAVAATGLLVEHLAIMMAGLFLLATQSAFFGPSKYGILPELKTEAELSAANGILNLVTFAAILGGTILATVIVNDTQAVVLCLSAAALIGFVSSLFVERVPAANPGEPLAWNPIPDFFRNWALIRENPTLRNAVIALSFFWFCGAVLQLNTIVYVNDAMKAPPNVSGMLLALVVIGIAVGSGLVGALSKGRIEVGLVPLGALGMSVFTMDLSTLHQTLWRPMMDAFFIGAFAGLYQVPLAALVQARSPAAQRGRILATVNFLSFIAILAASGFIWVLGNGFQRGPEDIFFALGLVSLAATVLLCAVIPEAWIRWGLYVLVTTVYRIRVRGQENIPAKGPALFVSNHVSYADPFLVASAIPQKVHFLMARDLYENPAIHPLVKLMGAIPVSSRDTPRNIMKSLVHARHFLEQGHAVGLFAEGEISRLGGATLGFKRGVEMILKDQGDVPVIPVHLEGVWGSIFSYEGKKFIWKWPKRFPYPVTITFGKPMYQPASSDVRQAVMDLGADAFADHRQADPTLFDSFLTLACSEPSRPLVEDSTGTALTAHRLLTGAALMGEKLKTLCASFQRSDLKSVGILLPPSVGAAVANVALAGQGFIAVNLNYTLSKETVDLICKKAGVDILLTSPKMIEKLGWEADSRMVYLEDIRKTIGHGRKILTACALRVLPKRLIRRWFFPHAHRRLDDVATVMFTSGSTGDPKGVVLTEANVLSNIQSVSMVLQMDDSDALLGVLPFFHSFGYTTALWYPLISGLRTAYHVNPLDSKTIAEMVMKRNITAFMGTPTFLTAYVRRIPEEAFRSLKFMIVGAEKLRAELAQAFEKKFSIPVLEGYGCTELSPVVALNIPDLADGDVFQTGRKVGKVGRPLPGVTVKTVDPHTFEKVPMGTPGLLLVKGPNVMKGYLDDPQRTAEVIRDGWYVTGDIATVDDDGFIQITDRLSRFSKIAGEMVPHVLIEQKLQDVAETVDRQFVVTSVPDEKKGEALAVLISGYPGSIDELWKKLTETDLPNLWIPARDHFFVLPELPVLGSGKVDLQLAKNIAATLVAAMNK